MSALGLPRDEWNIGIVNQPLADIVRHGIVAPVRWFPRNSWQILADPFCQVRADGSVTIYAERMNHWVGKGAIVSATLRPGDDPLRAQFDPFFVGPSHLSYPCVVQDGDQTYMVMESHEAGALHLWREANGSWVFARTLMQRPAVDATLFRHAGLWWLFCTFIDDRPNERLHIFYSTDIMGEWSPVVGNPVVVSPCARPAGSLFWVGNQLIRPSQDSTVTYGGSLMLNVVDVLSTVTYSERPLRAILPPDEYYADGIHTIAGAGDFTVIDGKRWHNGVMLNTARRAVTKLLKVRRLRFADQLLEDGAFIKADELHGRPQSETY